MSPRNEAKTEGLSPHLRNILVTKHLPVTKRPQLTLVGFVFVFLNPRFGRGRIQNSQDLGLGEMCFCLGMS